MAAKAAKNLLLDASEVARNKAEAGLFSAEIAQKQLLVQELQLGLAKKLRHAAIEDADDFNHGYFRWNEKIDEAAVQLWTAMLRAYTRINEGNPLRKNILIELNSPGGSIIDGFQLFDELVRIRKQGFRITIRIRGIAASMASVIFQAADVRQIGANGNLMIHRAGFGASGKAYEIEDEVEFVKKLEGQIVSIFSERSSKSKKHFENMLEKRKDLYFNAEACIKEKLADEIV